MSEHHLSAGLLDQRAVDLGLNDEHVARFLAKVDRTDGCWNWTASLQGRGYGCYCLGGKKFQAHRWIYQRLSGEVSPDTHICHRCDNPKCVRPSHLFPGSRSVNMADCARKGRNPMQKNPQNSHLRNGKQVRAKGERQGSSKLKTCDIVLIRELAAGGSTSTEISLIYGINAGHIRRIVARKAWAHVGN